MNATEEKMCLENIEEFIMDHDKVVTYKWLSRTLKIPVDSAKRLLNQYALTCEKKSCLSSTFVVGGELQNSEGISVMVVKDTELSNVKTQFKKVLWEQLYSLHKINQVFSLHTLYLVNGAASQKEDKDEYSPFNFGVIPYWKNVTRNELDARNLETSQIKVESKQKLKKTVPPPKTEAFAENVSKTPPKTSPKKISPSPNHKEETVGKGKNQTTAVKSSGIAAMFASQASKKDSAPKSKVKSESTLDKRKNSSISSFFSGQLKSSVLKTQEKGEEPEVPKNAGGSETTKNDCKPTVTKEVPQIVQQTDLKANEIDKESRKESLISLSKKTKVSNSKKNKKTAPNKTKQKGSESPQKKRKRVIVESDSEESRSDESGAESDEASFHESPPPSPIKVDDEVIPPTPDEPKRKKRRKTIEKTVMDKDGFLNTVKEVLYESCSDDEENDENKKSNVNNKTETKEQVKPEKIEDTKAKKQQSLMNFFKKK